MAHYAILNENNVVINVINGIDETDTSQNWEDFYGDIHTSILGQNVTCKRTSYNTIANEHRLGGVPFRKNYAIIGYEYNSNFDGFVPPKPFSSWLLNGVNCVWEAPTPYPADGQDYQWNEESLSWDLTK